MVCWIHLLHVKYGWKTVHCRASGGCAGSEDNIQMFTARIVAQTMAVASVGG